MNADLYSRRLEDLSKRLVGVFYDVYNELGHGFLESVYDEAFAIALAEIGIPHRRQVAVPVLFRGHPVGFFKADFVVENEIVLELKSHARSKRPTSLNCSIICVDPIWN